MRPAGDQGSPAAPSTLSSQDSSAPADGPCAHQLSLELSFTGEEVSLGPADNEIKQAVQRPRCPGAHASVGLRFPTKASGTHGRKCPVACGQQ